MRGDRTRTLGLKGRATTLAWMAQHAMCEWKFDFGIEKLLVVEWSCFNIYEMSTTKITHKQKNKPQDKKRTD
jgi:hypothetical protein